MRRPSALLERIAAVCGYLLNLGTDNGTEFIAVALDDWAEQHNVTLKYRDRGQACYCCDSRT
jgi:putative transposase